ncbi:MAG: HAD-IC family P-type ATPase [Terrimonas sp.]|nr:HAD-IC family P-type ATPase [Terrimonas sp.]
MPIASNHYNIKGLTKEQVINARHQYGKNILEYKKENGLIDALTRLVKEPMVILLLVTSSIYFISGNPGDGIFLAVSILLVAAISLYQDSRSRNALRHLKDLTQPKCKVIREGQEEEIYSEELVTGDHLVVEEGGIITADGLIIHSNDFSVNESILTGESFSVFKDKTEGNNMIYAGTTVTGGLAIAIVTQIGNATQLGKIGKSLESIREEKTPLEAQINNFVIKMVVVGIVVFLLVWGINFFRSYNILDSLLKALTLAMSILPEEIPVAFTTFMALGAWRLMKKGIIVKQMKTVETLGIATVICVDKTGTITENRMSLARLFSLSSGRTFTAADELNKDELELIQWSMWASEPIPFDPMEVALHRLYEKKIIQDERQHYKLVHEYPLEGKPPMMTHVFENTAGNRIIAAKGAPEALMKIGNLSAAETQKIETLIEEFSKAGYRILGVGISAFKGDHFPEKQQALPFSFKGILAFYDPPKENIENVFQDFYRAGVDIKIITGDNTETTVAIAQQIGFRNIQNNITGENLMASTDEEIKQAVSNCSLFTRMFPEAKLKIINTLKDQDQIVAMTGDGVNDGPALKAAHIGIAMGKKGAEIAKQAASLILTEDDLSKMVEAIAMGRKIYANLKKAIQYIISIHIPIILTVFIPLVLGWKYPAIFSPVHIIFLELIMGPTCSIIYENEPMENNTMIQPPRAMTSTFFKWKEIIISIIQGLMITAGTLFIYRFAVAKGYDEALTRTMTFTTLIIANIVLTLTNRSFYYSILTTLQYKNNMVPMIILITLSLVGLLLYVPPLTGFFAFEKLNGTQLLVCIATGFLAVIWVEGYKWRKRIR